LSVEYQAILDAGFILQIDDSYFASMYDVLSDLAEYRRWAADQVDIINYALRDLPQDRIRFHVCWGSWNDAKPDAIFAFYPGASGAQFLIQYAQSGLKDQVPLYTAFTIDEITLPRQKDAALGVPGAQEWVNDLPNEQNKRFVSDYQSKYPGWSPTFYGAQTYDAAMLINSAVAATKGDLSDKDTVRAGLEKAEFKSVRGKFRFGNNHMPIQNFYLQDVVRMAIVMCSRRWQRSSKMTRTDSMASVP
jgi:hypothetical protein